MTSLYLNASQIEGISNQTFKGLTQLLTLHLEDNTLSRLESGQEFDELIALRELYLHNNALEYIHPDTLRPLFHSLQVLTLHGNRLKVDFHVWEYIGPELRSLSLRDNQWTCQCDFVEKLQFWKLWRSCFHDIGNVEWGYRGPRVTGQLVISIFFEVKLE